MMPAPKKKAARRISQRTVKVPENALAISMSSVDRLKWWAGGIAAIGAALGVIITGWTWAGLPTVVLDRELKSTLGALKVEVQGTIDKTKGIVIEHADTSKREVKAEVNEVDKKVGVLIRRLDLATVEQLEDRLSRLFQQKTEKLTSLSNIDGLLQAKGLDQNQRQNLITRKAETESVVKWLEGEMSSVQTRLQRAKQGVQ